jgi:Cu+-exporting ATPase
MTDPHSHDPQAKRCGCSEKREAELASVVPAVALASCCSGEPASGAPATVDQAHSKAKPGGCCSGDQAARGTTTVTDPVCGMTVDPAKTAHHAEHAGQTYHFCSTGCRTKFVANSDAYLGNKPKPEPKATPGAIWTCPMHPQIRQEGPGTCPICGMALEPEEPSLDDPTPNWSTSPADCGWQGRSPCHCSSFQCSPRCSGCTSSALPLRLGFNSR